ncbi:hypothetical protein D3C75_972970 [compost metagenome]
MQLDSDEYAANGAAYALKPPGSLQPLESKNDHKGKEIAGQPIGQFVQIKTVCRNKATPCKDKQGNPPVPILIPVPQHPHPI